MIKTEFMKYLDFIKELFPRANVPTNKEIIAVWYKPFVNVNFNIAKDMAVMYLQEEQNSFNFARLLQYKTRAMADKTYYGEENTEVCKFCGNTGYVQFRGYNNKAKCKIDVYKRCICSVGDSLIGNIAQVTQEELLNITEYRVIEKEVL